MTDPLPGHLIDIVVEAPVMLFEIEADGTISTAVGAGRQSLHRAPVPGDSIYDLYADIPAGLAAVERAMAGESFTGTSRMPGRVGEVVFETTYVPVYGPDGGVQSVRGMALDVTRRAQAQDAEAQATREALAIARTFKSLTDRLQTEREDERQRMARDIHDDLGQSLTALRFEARWLRRRLSEETDLDRDAMLSRLTDVDSLLDDATAAVHRITSGLRPPALGLAGLTGAVQAEVTQFQTRTGIQCQMRSGLSSSVEATLLEPVAVSLFRVIQEALTNVARHAGASAVTVRLVVEGGLVVAEVQDDGCGFDPDATRDGALGLVGARERIAIHHGRFSMQSAPGQGTTVRAAVSPIPPSLARARGA